MFRSGTPNDMEPAELEDARLGFNQYLRRKRFSPQFIARHGEELFATATLEYSRKVAEGAEIDNPGGFIVTCASQRTKSLLEAESHTPRLVSTERVPMLVGDEDGSAEDVALEEDRFRKVQDAVARLSEDERRLIELSYLEGYRVREVARKLEWHPSKAQRCHRTARKHLHELLGVSSADDLEVEIGLAAYLSLAAEASTGAGVSDVLERVAQRSAEGVASLKQHATTAYYRAVDPTPLAGARPGTVAAVLASCIAIGGGAAQYCLKEGVNPIGAATGLIASTDEPQVLPPTEPPPAPVYTPAEPAESEAPPAPPEPTQPAGEETPEPKPEPPPPGDPYEPVHTPYMEEEEEESAEEPVSAEPSRQPKAVPANAGPQFGGPP